MFVRAGCELPQGIHVRQERFSDTWAAVEGVTSSELDRKIRAAGWHFICIADPCSSLSMGRTVESVTRRAIGVALQKIPSGFNGAKLSDVQVSRYPGFVTVTATLHPRQIQPKATLAPAFSLPARQMSTR